MGKYSPVERRMVILYDTIEGKYVVTGNLSCLSLFLSYLSKRLLRRELIHMSVFISSVQIMANTKCELNQITRKIEERWDNGRIETIPSI